MCNFPVYQNTTANNTSCVGERRDWCCEPIYEDDVRVGYASDAGSRRILLGLLCGGVGASWTTASSVMRELHSPVNFTAE